MVRKLSIRKKNYTYRSSLILFVRMQMQEPHAQKNRTLPFIIKMYRKLNRQPTRRLATVRPVAQAARVQTHSLLRSADFLTRPTFLHAIVQTGRQILLFLLHAIGKWAKIVELQKVAASSVQRKQKKFKITAPRRRRPQCQRQDDELCAFSNT